MNEEMLMASDVSFEELARQMKAPSHCPRPIWTWVWMALVCCWCSPPPFPAIGAEDRPKKEVGPAEKPQTEAARDGKAEGTKKETKDQKPDEDDSDGKKTDNADQKSDDSKQDDPKKEEAKK